MRFAAPSYLMKEGVPATCSHLRCIFLILVIIIIVLVLLFLVIRFFGIIFFLLLGLLNFAQCLPLLCESVRLSLVVSDDDVVEDRAPLPLPQIKAQKTEVSIL